MKEMTRRDFFSAAAVSGLGLGLAGVLTACNGTKVKSFDMAELYPVYKDGSYQEKNFLHLINKPGLGLEASVIQNHLGLYHNYVKNVNRAEREMVTGNVNEFSMKHLAFSLNGMALHDIYFSNMTTEETKRSYALDDAIKGTFGSFDKYMKNLTELAMQVDGWSITAFNLLNGRLFNYALKHHSDNFPNFVIPILALDVYEHAYVAQFKKEGKAEYIEAFKKTINWDLVSRRLEAIQNLT